MLSGQKESDRNPAKTSIYWQGFDSNNVLSLYTAILSLFQKLDNPLNDQMGEFFCVLALQQ